MFCCLCMGGLIKKLVKNIQKPRRVFARLFQHKDAVIVVLWSLLTARKEKSSYPLIHHVFLKTILHGFDLLNIGSALVNLTRNLIGGLMIFTIKLAQNFIIAFLLGLCTKNATARNFFIIQRYLC